MTIGICLDHAYGMATGERAGQREAVITEVVKQDGRIDILINNAGYGAMGPMAESPEAALKQQFETNTFAPVALAQQVIPHMIHQGSGLIINITSVSGIFTTPFSGMYCASKAALSSMTEAMRMELEPLGIDVMDVQPGAIRSNFGDNAFKTLDILPQDSIYKSINDALQARARASQDNPSPAEGLADKVLSVVESGKTPPVVRYGHGSAAFPFMARWLPRGLVHRILQKKFWLNHLKSE